MEIRDGFIVGISNYCDRWCERCPFTADCRLFADSAEADAHHDPNMAAMVHAPVRPESTPPSPPQWLQGLMEQANEDAENMSDEEVDAIVDPPMPGEHALTCARDVDYCVHVHEWSRNQDDCIRTRTDDPMDVITWFAGMIMSKTGRAFHGLAMFDGDRRFPPDHVRDEMHERR